MINLRLYFLTRKVAGKIGWDTGIILKNAVIHSNHTSPDVADVGAYKGLSSIYLAYACKRKGKRLKSFDWFQGPSPAGPVANSRLTDNRYSHDIEDYELNLRKSGLRNYVDLITGDARETVLPVLDKDGFSVAFLDVGGYEVTHFLLEQFKFLVKGGETIICHDYNTSGVKKAVDEFLVSFNGGIKISDAGDRTSVILEIIVPCDMSIRGR